MRLKQLTKINNICGFKTRPTTKLTLAKQVYHSQYNQAYFSHIAFFDDDAISSIETDENAQHEALLSDHDSYVLINMPISTAGQVNMPSNLDIQEDIMHQELNESIPLVGYSVDDQYAMDNNT
eukprot:71018_1